MIKQYEVALPEFPRGFHLITDMFLEKLSELPQYGLLNVFVKHTSAGITINENTSIEVREDFERFFNALIPEGHYYKHDEEGLDDMPAHLKSSLVGSSVTVPISDNKINLGEWQGIYLCEFRNSGGPRTLVVTIYS